MAMQLINTPSEESYAEERVMDIIAALTAEIEAQTEHAELLAAQTQALIACDRAGYARLHDRHEQILTDSEQRSFRFRSLTAQGGKTGSLRGEIEAWPESERENALELSSRLKTIADEVNALCERNSSLIRGELSLIAFQVNFILAAAQQDTSYASNGINLTTQASRLLNSVA